MEGYIRWMDECKGTIDGWKEGMGGKTLGMDGLKDEQIDGWMERYTIKMDECMDSVAGYTIWMDGWMEG